MLRQALIALTIIAAVTVLLAVLPKAPPMDLLPYDPALGLVIAIGICLDGWRLRFWEYQTGFGRRPWVLLLLASLWWIIVLPWYLTVRERVVRGQVPRRVAKPEADGSQERR